MRLLRSRNALLLLVAMSAWVVSAPCHAQPIDFTYSDWQQMSEQWKRGYLYAVMNVQTQVMQGDSKEHASMLMGYRACTTGKLTDAAFVKAVESYLIRHPEAMTQSIIAVALNTLHEVCRPYLGSK